MNPPRAASRTVIFAMLVASGLRVLLLGRKSLWLDEASDLQVALAGQQALWAGKTVQYHPPLYYWLLGWWAQVGQSEFVLRLPSAVLGSISVLIVYLIAKELWEEPAALSAIWLVALSPLLVWYSQEVRNYALVMALGLTGTLATLRFLRTARPEWWLLFLGATIAAFYTHYNALVLIPVTLATAAIFLATERTSGRKVVTWLAAWPMAFIAYWPWLNTPAATRGFRLLASDRSHVALLLLNRFGIVFTHVFPIIAMGALIFTVVGPAAIYWLFRRHSAVLQRLRTHNSVRYCLLGLFFVALLAWVVPRGYTLKRQLTMIWPFVLLIFAWFWPWREGTRRWLAVVLSAALLASLVSITLIPKDQWRETVAFIGSEAQSGDLVLLLPSYMTIPFDYYDQGQSQRTGIASSYIDRMESLLEGHERVWLVAHTKDIADSGGAIVGWLEQNTERVAGRSFYNIDVSLYRR